MSISAELPNAFFTSETSEAQFINSDLRDSSTESEKEINAIALTSIPQLTPAAKLTREAQSSFSSSPTSFPSQIYVKSSEVAISRSEESAMQDATQDPTISPISILNGEISPTPLSSSLLYPSSNCSPTAVVEPTIQSSHQISEDRRPLREVEVPQDGDRAFVRAIMMRAAVNRVGMNTAIDEITGNPLLNRGSVEVPFSQKINNLKQFNFILEEQKLRVLAAKIVPSEPTIALHKFMEMKDEGVPVGKHRSARTKAFHLKAQETRLIAIRKANQR